MLSADEMEPEPDPHFASAMARISGRRFVSSILPWRTCGPRWAGQDLAARVRATLDALRSHIDERTVWGGDWNQALEGPEHAGSLDGRRQLVALTDGTGLSVPTRTLGHAAEGHRSIDHVAVPIDMDFDGAFRVPADSGGLRLSDHAAYVVSISGEGVR